MPGEQVNVALGHTPLPAYPGQASSTGILDPGDETYTLRFLPGTA